MKLRERGGLTALDAISRAQRSRFAWSLDVHECLLSLCSVSQSKIS